MSGPYVKKLARTSRWRRVGLVVFLGSCLGAWCLAAGCATGVSADPDGAVPQPNVDGSTTVIDGSTPQDDGGMACSDSPCSLLDQCGCSATQVCDLDRDMLAAGGTACRDVTQPGTEGANCTTLSECAGGYICVGPEGARQCRKFCDPEAMDPGCNGGKCYINIVHDDDDDGVAEPVPGAVTCSKVCSPEKVTDNACPSSPQLACRVYNSDGSGVTDCGVAPATGGGENTDCETSSQCASGFACAIFESGGKCRQTCVAPGGACTNGSYECVSYQTPLVANGTEYGYCGTPPTT